MNAIKFQNPFSVLLDTIKQNILGYKEFTLRDKKDIESILSNPEDRQKYNDAIEQLKKQRLQGKKNVSMPVEFSDRTIHISIE